MRIDKSADTTKRITHQPPQDTAAIPTTAPKTPLKTQSKNTANSDIQLVDIIEISTEGKEKSDELQGKRDELRGRYRTLMDEVKKAQEIGEGMAESMKVMLRCQKIAMRIMMGDNVPTEDERYLAENDIELYSKAMQLRMQKIDPEDYDSLLEDEEDDGTSIDGENTAAVPSGGISEPVEFSTQPDGELSL